MDFKRPRNLFIDNDKMANLQHGTPESPISFIYDEIEKYALNLQDILNFANIVNNVPVENFITFIEEAYRYSEEVGKK